MGALMEKLAKSIFLPIKIGEFSKGLDGTLGSMLNFSSEVGGGDLLKVLLSLFPMHLDLVIVKKKIVERKEKN